VIGLIHFFSILFKLYYAGPLKHSLVWMQRKNVISVHLLETWNAFPSTHLTCQSFLAQTWNIGSRHLPRNFTTWNDVEIHVFTFWVDAGRVAETPTTNCSVQIPHLRVSRQIFSITQRKYPKKKKHQGKCVTIQLELTTLNIDFVTIATDRWKIKITQSVIYLCKNVI
jgi:hypothetical protein